MKKAALVITNGCPENRLDSAKIEQLLLKNDWLRAQNVGEADLIVFNTCGLTKSREDKSVSLIQRLRKNKKRNAKLIICGCLPKINRGRIPEIHNGVISAGANTRELASELGITTVSSDVDSNYLIPSSAFPSTYQEKLGYLLDSGEFFSIFNPYSVLLRLKLPRYRQYWNAVNIVGPNTFYIKTSSGCEHRCSYCAVKASRGTIKSKSIKQVKKEFLGGLEGGYTMFALIGTDLGSYGKDIGTDLLELLREMLSVEGRFEIKLRNVHPKLLIEELPGFLDVVKSKKISHVTTAIQHGNNRILGLMRRGYEIGDCKLALNALKNCGTHVDIRTQLMVGFPGESDSEFYDTVRLVNEVDFDFVEVYQYSPRPNTLAATMSSQVPARKANRRNFILTKTVLDRMRAKYAVPAACSISGGGGRH